MKTKLKKPPFPLDETWEYCLAMWKWITEHCSEESDLLTISKLKDQWLEQNQFEPIYNSCFFCEFLQDKTVGCGKGGCPGEIIDPTFSCYDNEYHWYLKPHKFYQKLVELNKKRNSERRK